MAPESQSPELDPTISKVRQALLPIEIDDDTDKITREGQRRAAVLMPLVLREDWSVILTQRPQTMPRHAGQISFPGGRVENDETAFEGALRETHEEIGVRPRDITILGRLPSFDAVSDFRVTPFVGIVDPNALIIPDPHEVDDVFEVPFDFVMDSNNHIPRDVEWQDKKFTLFDMPYDDLNGIHRNIWGMTAMMMYRLWERGFST